MSDMLRRSGNAESSDLVEVIRQNPPSMAFQAGLSRDGAGGRAGGCGRNRRRLRSRVVALLARFDPDLPRAAVVRRWRQSSRALFRAPAAAPRHRRAGRAVSRGTRAVAAGGDHQRGGSGSAADARAPYAVGTRSSSGRIGGREGAEPSSTAAVSSGRRCAATPEPSPRLPSRRLPSSRSAPPSCATRSPLCWSSREMSRQPRRTASRSRPGMSPCRAAPTRASPLRSWVRRGAGGADGAGRRRTPPFERMPLVRAEQRPVRRHALRSGRTARLLSSRRVECSSTHYTLKVVDLPYVQKLELEYHFPAYTGLAPRRSKTAATSPSSRGPRFAFVLSRR